MPALLAIPVRTTSGLDRLGGARREMLAGVYPDRYRLPAVTEHILALLERRRPGFQTWNADVEEQLRSEALRALDDIGRQFREVAEDPEYWRRLGESIQTVALPRYFRKAQEHHAFELRRFGIWRGGDFVSRAVYVLVGVGAATMIARTAIPDWLVPIPLAMILIGPFLPEMQAWWARRSWIKELVQIVQDMRGEQQHIETVRPLSEAPTAGLPSDISVVSIPRRKERP